MWDRVAKGRNVTTVLLSEPSWMSSEADAEQVIADGNSARYGRAHAPGCPQCDGAVGISARMLSNWLALWWSVPCTERKEHVMLCFSEFLQAHRAARLPDDRWRLQYTSLVREVCRDACLALTGLRVSTLQAARVAALRGANSSSSPAERGMHGGSVGNNSKAAAYLSVGQWLEWYAQAHAEQSPSDARADLPAGRKLFYDDHYRRDILEKHGVTEADAAELAPMRWHRVSGRILERLGQI